MSGAEEDRPAGRARSNSFPSSCARRRWSAAEDACLRAAVEEIGEKNWKSIAERVASRNHVQCLQRWKKVLRPGLIKGRWTSEEDNVLRTTINSAIGGAEKVNWGDVAVKIPGRSAKQCRERWCHHLDPSVRKGDWTAEEDAKVMELQAQLGNSWAQISKALEGRTENAVKIRWKSVSRRRCV